MLATIRALCTGTDECVTLVLWAPHNITLLQVVNSLISLLYLVSFRSAHCTHIKTHKNTDKVEGQAEGSKAKTHPMGGCVREGLDIVYHPQSEVGSPCNPFKPFPTRPPFCSYLCMNSSTKLFFLSAVTSAYFSLTECPS